MSYDPNQFPLDYQFPYYLGDIPHCTPEELGRLDKMMRPFWQEYFKTHPVPLPPTDEEWEAILKKRGTLGGEEENQPEEKTDG